MKFLTIEALRQQAYAGTSEEYVWPYEGRFVSDNEFAFHGGKVLDSDTWVEGPTGPLTVDAASARAFVLVYDAIAPHNKERLDEYSKSRGLFCWAMDKLVWPNVRFGST